MRFSLNGPLRPVLNCHCVRCRRFTGHFMAGTSTDLGDLVFDSGEELLNWWIPAEEPTVGYGSCSVCGSSLFWRADDKPGRLSIAGGCLEEPTGLRTILSIYTSEAGDYYRIDDSLPASAYDSSQAEKGLDDL